QTRGIEKMSKSEITPGITPKRLREARTLKMGVFQKSEPALASQPAAEILKFQRPDWALFRTVEGLQQRAGVPKSKLRRLGLKELADNGLDSGANVRVGKVDGGLASFSARHLELLELLFAYWREAEVEGEVRAPSPGPIQ